MKNNEKRIKISEAKLKQMVNEAIMEEMYSTKEEKMLRNVIRESVRQQLSEEITGDDILNFIDKALNLFGYDASKIKPETREKIRQAAQTYFDNAKEMISRSEATADQLISDYSAKATAAKKDNVLQAAIYYAIALSLRMHKAAGDFKVIGAGNAINKTIFDAGKGAAEKYAPKVRGLLVRGLQMLLRQLTATPNLKASPARQKVAEFTPMIEKDPELNNAFDKAAEAAGMDSAVNAMRAAVEPLQVDSSFEDYKQLALQRLDSISANMN